MSNKQDIAVITTRWPYPLEKGDKLRVFYQIRELSKEFNVHLFALSYDHIGEKDISPLEQYLTSYQIFRLSKFTLPFKLIWYSLLRRWPVQVSYFYSSRAKRLIADKIDQQNINLIYSQLTRSIPYTEGLRQYKILDLMDAFSYGMAKRSVELKGLKRHFYKWESRSIRTYEEAHVPKYHKAFAISPQDRVRMSHLYDYAIEVLPNGIEITTKESAVSSPGYDLVFVGNMGYEPNIQAALFLVNQVLPVYRDRYGDDLSINVVGARPDSKVVALQSSTVNVTGWIDNIADGYRSGRVFVAPIFSGMGQQNKLMEAIHYGLPCVVSPEVAAPFGFENESELMVAEDVEQFVNHIHLCLNHKVDLKLMNDKALDLLNQKYTWTQATKPLIQAMHNHMQVVQ